MQPTDTTDNTTPAETEKAVANRLKKGKAAVEKKAVALSKLVIEYVSPDDIKPNDYNPNRQDEHDFQLLCMSMLEDGFTQPVVCLKDLTIVDGEHRWRAARALHSQGHKGFEKIPVVRADMTPEQAKIATLRHNRARGSEDIELSAALLRDLEALGALDWAADSLMLDDEEIQKLLQDIPAPEALANQEYAESWEPHAGNDAEQDLVDNPTEEVRMAGSSDLSVAATGKAADVVREREKRLAEAKTAEEKRMIRTDLNIFRIQLLFSGDEAKVVRAVLGDRPAVTLLGICNDIAQRDGIAIA